MILVYMRMLTHCLVNTNVRSHSDQTTLLVNLT